MVIPLVDKEETRSKRALSKSQNNKYGYMKKQALGLLPWIYKKLEAEVSGTISLKAADVLRELMVDKSNSTIYAGLRYLLFFEGINVSIRNNGKEDLIILKPISGCGFGLSESIVKAYDNMEMDGWYIKRNDLGISFKHSIVKKIDGKDHGNNIYSLESSGDIYFDRRDLTKVQAVEFAKYMSCKYAPAPDFVYLTPINLVIPDYYIQDLTGCIDIDLDKIGKEFRIVRLGDGPEFTVLSIFGKEFKIYEHDVDEMIKGCSIHHIIYSFDEALMYEKTPERIEILKKILPELRTKNSAIIKNHDLIIINSSGTFMISLSDGTLHKIYGFESILSEYDSKYDSKYICVGPIGNVENFIIFNGYRYKIDRVMGVILAKAVMLLEEKYPDERTLSQIIN